MTTRSFLACAAAVVIAGAVLRTVWLTSDPPTTTVGIVWHDEGPWVHNARNRALWGVWRTDDWNPVFIAPVFTALEYAAFRTVGVGTWQARTVPVASGLLAIIALIAGLAASTNRRAAILGGALLSADYVFVMWNRAALMESTMTAAIVVSWATYALASRRPSWGIVAGVSAMLAYFTKASAAFFVAALLLDAGLTILRAQRRVRPDERADEVANAGATKAALFTMAGVAITAAILGATFVLPHWTDYHFYNVTMSIERKPAYTLHAILQRASWLPVAHDVFSAGWFVVATGALGLLAVATRWRTASPAHRLLVLWVIAGLAEVVAHDAGNARRYVMFIPAWSALAAVFLAADRPWWPKDLASTSLRRWTTAAVVLGLAYIVIGSLLRIAVLGDVHANHYRLVVRVSALVAVAMSVLVLARWRAIDARASAWRPTPSLVAGVIVLSLVWDGAQYVEWMIGRTTLAYDASVAIGHLLPPGTLVQGKLANGLALENRIRPLFIGNGFGNYADRLERDDVRYILTYVLPTVGFESQEHSGLIPDLLAHYPAHRVVATFEVTEPPGDVTVSGLPDDRARAALIDKFPQRGMAARAGAWPPRDAAREVASHARD